MSHDWGLQKKFVLQEAALVVALEAELQFFLAVSDRFSNEKWLIQYLLSHFTAPPEGWEKR